MHPYLVSNHGDECRTFSGDRGPSSHVKSNLNTGDHSAETGRDYPTAGQIETRAILSSVSEIVQAPSFASSAAN